VVLQGSLRARKTGRTLLSLHNRYMKRKAIDDSSRQTLSSVIAKARTGKDVPPRTGAARRRTGNSDCVTAPGLAGAPRSEHLHAKVSCALAAPDRSCSAPEMCSDCYESRAVSANISSRIATATTCPITSTSSKDRIRRRSGESGLQDHISALPKA
jgi:hypothetical protein